MGWWMAGSNVQWWAQVSNESNECMGDVGGWKGVSHLSSGSHEREIDIVLLDDSPHRGRHDELCVTLFGRSVSNGC